MRKNSIALSVKRVKRSHGIKVKNSRAAVGEFTGVVFVQFVFVRADL